MTESGAQADDRIRNVPPNGTTPSSSLQQASLAVRERIGDGTIVIELAGDLDMATEDLVRDALANAAAQRPERLVIDLSDLSFIDSSGIRLMVVAHQRFSDGGGTTLEIRPGNRSVQRVFEVTQLDEVLPFVKRSG